MTTQTLPIRRRTNGTINIDHYRNWALMERKAAMTGSMRGVILLGSLLIVAGAFMAGLTGTVAPTMQSTVVNGATITAALAAR